MVASFLAGKLLTHDFGVAIIFISVNSEVLSAILLMLAKKILHPHFFGILKSTWWNVWYQSPYITETFTKLVWTLDKVGR